MHKLLLYIFIICSISSFSQATKIKIKKEKEEKEKEKIEKPIFYNQLTLDLYYGNRVYAKSYYNQINTIDHINLNLPTSFVGFGFSGYTHYFKKDIWVFLANYYKILPTKVFIDDSLNTKLSGYAMGYGLGPSLSNAKKTINLNLYFGFSTGRTTLSKNDFISQKNQFFSPKISLQPKFIIKRIAISIMVEAEYDISNPAWHQPVFEKRGNYLLRPFDQTCLTALVSLGYKLY
ncbi:MAG: hypothetical protein U0W65_06625 [Bacteroidia bacterium]